MSIQEKKEGATSYQGSIVEDTFSESFNNDQFMDVDRSEAGSTFWAYFNIVCVIVSDHFLSNAWKHEYLLYAFSYLGGYWYSRSSLCLKTRWMVWVSNQQSGSEPFSHLLTITFMFIVYSFCFWPGSCQPILPSS